MKIQLFIYIRKSFVTYARSLDHNVYMYNVYIHIYMYIYLYIYTYNLHRIETSCSVRL